jgi:hypothetical protein
MDRMKNDGHEAVWFDQVSSTVYSISCNMRRPSTVLLSLLLIACTASPEPAPEEAAIQEPNSERERPVNEEKSDRSKFEGSLSLQVNSDDWYMKEGSLDCRIHSGPYGSVIRIGAERQGDTASTDRLSFFLPYFEGEDTLISGAKNDRSGFSLGSIGQKSHAGQVVESSIRVRKVRKGDRFMLEGEFSARLRGLLGGSDFTKEVVLEQGRFSSGWMDTPPHRSGLTDEPGPAGRTYGYAIQRLGKYPGTKTTVVFYSTVFKYRDNPTAIGIVLRELRKTFDERARALPVKPEPLISGAGALKIENPAQNWNKGLTNDSRMDRVLEMREKGPFMGGEFELIEVIMPDSL